MLNPLPLVEKKRDGLKRGLTEMGDAALAALRSSVDCLRRQDVELAHAIVAADAPIDRQRRQLEQECLVVLAAHKPAGRDLRVIGATFELVTELERIADYAVDAARSVIEVGTTRFPPEPLALVVQVGEEAATMFAEAMAAYGEEGDDAQARAAAAGRGALVGHAQAAVEAIGAAMRDDPEHCKAGVLLLWAVRDFQRAAARATNIAERVVYIATGDTPDLD
jgi:phosphate transport system protein